MNIQHVSARDLASLDQVNHASQTLALVHGVGDEGLSLGAELDGRNGGLVGDAIDLGVVVGVEVDVGLGDVVGLEANLLSGELGDAKHLVEGLLDLARGVNANDLAGARAVLLSELEAGDDTSHGRASDGADEDGVEEDAQLLLLGLNLESPSGKAKATERVV